MCRRATKPVQHDCGVCPGAAAEAHAPGVRAAQGGHHTASKADPAPETRESPRAGTET